MSKMSAAYGTRDEGFDAWLAMNEYLLDEEFLAGEVPGMPDHPYTEDGLRAAEREALRQFASPEEALSAEVRHTYDKFVRYVGETFVRGLGMQWTNKPMVDDGKPYIGVKFPGRPETLNIPTLVTSALARRTGSQWATVFQRKAEDRERLRHA